MVGNYYKAGPGTSKKVASRIVNPTRNETVGFGKFYVAENEVQGAKDVSKDNKSGIHIGGGKDAFSEDSIVASQAFEVLPITPQSAVEAYTLVLQHVGASFRRDTLDMRIIEDVKNGKGKFIDVQGGFPHGTDYDKTVTAWPQLKSDVAATDTDKDGMPDTWEIQHGLNTQDASDAISHTLHKHYTNIEMYLNGLLSK